MTLERSAWARVEDFIRDQSAHLEALPFTRALAEGTLHLDSYTGMLQALSIVHGVLETTLDRVEDPLLSAYWTPGLRLGPLLAADLKDLFSAPAGRASQGDDAALGITERIRIRSIQSPRSLLGYLFVLQEPLISRLVPPRDVESLFQLTPPTGLRYLSGLADDGVGPWPRVKKALEEDLSGRDGDAFLEGAKEALVGLEEVFNDLSPESERVPALQAVGLNPEAGRHPVPEDPREVEAALEGGRKCREVFPYYEARYGQRGRSFTNSDAAWIVALTDQDQETVTQQVLWLANLLAARGMPRVTMEVSLKEIHGALVQVKPEREEAYQKLLVTADTLRAARCGHLEEEAQEALAQEFEKRVSENGLEPPLGGAGRLLISAVMDDKAGVKGSLESLRSWMTDPVRFSQAWIDAVGDTLKAAADRSLSNPVAGEREDLG